jgi:hypothetical protein
MVPNSLFERFLTIDLASVTQKCSNWQYFLPPQLKKVDTLLPRIG